MGIFNLFGKKDNQKKQVEEVNVQEVKTEKNIDPKRDEINRMLADCFHYAPYKYIKEKTDDFNVLFGPCENPYMQVLFLCTVIPAALAYNYFPNYAKESLEKYADVYAISDKEGLLDKQCVEPIPNDKYMNVIKSLFKSFEGCINFTDKSAAFLMYMQISNNTKSGNAERIRTESIVNYILDAYKNSGGEYKKENEDVLYSLIDAFPKMYPSFFK